MDLYSIASFLNDFRVIAILITVIIAFVAMPFSNKRLYFLFAYLIFSILTNVVAIFTRESGNNLFLGYLIAPIFLILYTLFLVPKKDRKLRLVSYVLITIGLIINIFEGVTLDGGISTYNSLSLAYNSFIIGGLAIYGLISLRYDPKVDNMAKEPFFWIFIGIAIENIGTIISSSFYRYFQQNDTDILLRIAFVALIVDYIGTVLYCIGFSKSNNNKPRGKQKLAT